MKKKKLGMILVTGAMIVIIANTINYKMCIVHGVSMKPTLQDGDILRMKKYKGTIEHNDVVAIAVKNTKSDIQYLIKRVIAYEDDQLDIKNGVVRVNDKVVVQSADITQKINLKIPKGKVFVMGDNYRRSYDSRDIGCLNLKDIIAYKSIPKK